LEVSLAGEQIILQWAAMAQEFTNPVQLSRLGLCYVEPNIDGAALVEAEEAFG